MDTEGHFRVQQAGFSNHPERDVKIRPAEEVGGISDASHRDIRLHNGSLGL